MSNRNKKGWRHTNQDTPKRLDIEQSRLEAIERFSGYQKGIQNLTEECKKFGLTIKEDPLMKTGEACLSMDGNTLSIHRVKQTDTPEMVSQTMAATIEQYQKAEQLHGFRYHEDTVSQAEIPVNLATGILSSLAGKKHMAQQDGFLTDAPHFEVQFHADREPGLCNHASGRLAPPFVLAIGAKNIIIGDKVDARNLSITAMAALREETRLIKRFHGSRRHIVSCAYRVAFDHNPHFASMNPDMDAIHTEYIAFQNFMELLDGHRTGNPICLRLLKEYVNYVAEKSQGLPIKTGNITGPAVYTNALAAALDKGMREPFLLPGSIQEYVKEHQGTDDLAAACKKGDSPAIGFLQAARMAASIDAVYYLMGLAMEKHPEERLRYPALSQTIPEERKETRQEEGN